MVTEKAPMISEPDLARLWRVHVRSLWRWRNRGVLASDAKDAPGDRATHLYLYSTIDGFQQQRLTQGAVRLPSIGRLLNHQEWFGKALLTLSEAAERLGTSTSWVRKAIQNGWLPALQLGLDYRLAAVQVAQYKTELELAVDIDLAAQLLGISAESVRALMRRPIPFLRRVRKPGTARTYVSAKSLDRLLRRQLVHSGPKRWKRMRAKYNYEPLLSKEEITTRYHTHDRMVRRLMERQTTPYIRTIGGETRIPLHVVAQWHAPRQLVADVFDTSIATAVRWIDAHALCDIHLAFEQVWSCPTPSCMRRYLDRNRTSDTFSTDDWLQWRLHLRTPLVRGRQIAAITGATPHEIREAFAAGTLRGVHLPIRNKKDVAVLSTDVQALAHRVRRRNLHRAIDDV